MLIVFVGRGMKKAEVGYIDFGKAIEYLITWKLLWEEEVRYIGFEESIGK